MKVGLTYKGQPVEIDFVAGCNVHNGRDLSGGSIHEISGMTDLFRGIRMPEGHAVVINTYPWFESPRFNPCDGDTTDSSHIATDPRIPDDRVPQDWLPFIQWIERADDLTQSVGYLTQDAYENKNARFGFRYARIEHASQQEYETFRINGPANLLPPHQSDWLQGRPDPVYYNASEVPESVRNNPRSGYWHTWGRLCEGVIRIRPTEKQRSLLRAVWPASKPTYWTIADGVGRFKLASDATKPDDTSANGAISLTHFRTPYTAEAQAHQPQVFPVENNHALQVLNATTDPISRSRALIGDGQSSLGFVSCGVLDGPILEAVTGAPLRWEYKMTVDGVAITNAPTDGSNARDFSPLFQQDQYVISILQGFRG